MLSKQLRRVGKTLGFRLTLWYAAIFIFSSALLFGLAYFLVSAATREYDQKLVQAKMSEYVLMEQTEGLQALAREIRLEEEGNLESGFLVRLADARNLTLSLTVPNHWRRIDLRKIETQAVPAAEAQWQFSVSKGRGEPLELYCRRLSDGSILQIGKRPEKRGELLEGFEAIFAGVMIPVVLVGLAGGWILASRALRPIRELIRTVRRIDSGNMDARVPLVQTNDELEELVRLFNAMLGRIESLISGMREALDNLGHDLRTPLTRLNGTIETALRSESGAETLREALMDSAEEAGRIATTLETLMDISEAEKGIMNLKLEKTDVVPVIRQVLDLYEYVAEDKGVTVAATLPTVLVATVDSSRIRQAVANLVDNAVKFTLCGGRVDLKAAEHPGEIMILVRDNGVGIPESDLPKIFDRLFRGEKSRSHRGLGLGLSMVQAVVSAHHGRVEVESMPGKGATFTVFLPTAGPAGSIPP